MALIDKITEQSKAVGGVADIPAGEGLQNVPVGTMLAQIEQATKIMAAAHKGMHTGAVGRTGTDHRLFREQPEDFWREQGLLRRATGTKQKFLAALDNCNLVPVSDPNVPSHIHRIAKALALVRCRVRAACGRASRHRPRTPQAGPAGPDVRRGPRSRQAGGEGQGEARETEGQEMTDDGTYFWPESDGWHLTTGFPQILGPVRRRISSLS
jgi:hypothetical protein